MIGSPPVEAPAPSGPERGTRREPAGARWPAALRAGALCASSLAALAVALLTLTACRPHPEAAPEDAFAATAPNDRGQITITAAAGVIEANGEVLITNTDRASEAYAYATSAGSLYYPMAAEIGDVLTLAYTDPDGQLILKTLVVPLQDLSMHGRVVESTQTCLAFERDDLVNADLDSDSARFELVGDLVDEVRAFSRGSPTPFRLTGTPVLFGLGGCGLPLFEPKQLLDDADLLASSRHGQLQWIEGEEGGRCKALAVTAELPGPPDARGLEDEVLYALLPAGPDKALVDDLEVGTWLVLTGDLLEVSDDAELPCGLQPVAVDAALTDSGARLSVQGEVVEVGSGDSRCLSLTDRASGATYSLRGPLVEDLRLKQGEPTPIVMAGYPTTGVQADVCGAPLTLAGWGPPEGPPPGAPPGASP